MGGRKLVRTSRSRKRDGVVRLALCALIFLGAREAAGSNAIGVLGEAQPGDCERRPQRPVLLVLSSFGHTQAFFGVVAIVFDVTHRLILPSARDCYNDRRLQGCYAVNGTIVETLPGYSYGTNEAKTRSDRG